MACWVKALGSYGYRLNCGGVVCFYIIIYTRLSGVEEIATSNSAQSSGSIFLFLYCCNWIGVKPKIMVKFCTPIISSLVRQYS